MRISLNWLKDYLNINVTHTELANRFTMAGCEVKSIEDRGASWDKVFVGVVTNIDPHPNADRLRLAAVDYGQEPQTVVCGAHNFSVGDKVPFAVIGADLIDGHSGNKMRLKPAKIRGVESRGMICSEMELGISKSHEGILLLPPEAPVGMSLSEYMGDVIFDIDVTPNRPDCLSVIGFAWEAGALTGERVTVKDAEYNETETAVEDSISVEIKDGDLCPRYCAGMVRNVTIKDSPIWMQERLIASGLRPINNIVDISNYIMLEYGQPLHTFDYDRIRSKKIIVRRAANDEMITSLDGVDRKLNDQMLVIADGERAVAIAGVMGGANSEITEHTTNILVEAANFNQFNIHNTSAALNLFSESKYRFERGISPDITLPALKRALQLISELGGGEVEKGLIDVYPGKKPERQIELSQEKLVKLLGMDFSTGEIIETLSSVGCKCSGAEDANIIMVNPPYWRSDIKIPVDLIEEVARIRGYDQIPTTLLGEPLPPVDDDPIFGLAGNMRQGMRANGFIEVMHFSLTSLEMLQKASGNKDNLQPAPVRVANPMTSDMEYLRTHFRANLLNSYVENRRHEEGGIRIFEVGKIYLPSVKGQPEERETLCAVLGGQVMAKSWQLDQNMIDFYDAKGVVESLFLRLGLEPYFEKGQDNGLHPNKQADIIISGKKAGKFGQVHPVVLSAFEIAEPLFLIEIDLQVLIADSKAIRMYKPVPRFPLTVRDLALIIDKEITHQSVQQIISDFALVDTVELFDVYEGGNVPDGKKSLAYHIGYRSADHTLTDEEVNTVQEKILKRLGKELGAVLRG
jgi:phenylalanyl-tRNA synthetase beta chain